MGLASFGKSGLVKTAFDGPGGTGGTCVAVQSIGSAFRKLQAGRLVYLDIPCGVDGFHTVDQTVPLPAGRYFRSPCPAAAAMLSVLPEKHSAHKQP